MESLENKWIEVQCYKHDGLMHRIWDSVFVTKQEKNYIVVASDHTKVVEHDLRLWHTREPAIMIFFDDCWFNIIAMLKDDGITYYVNLASPYIIDKGMIKYIDYDLDLKLYPSNSIKIIDVKEYGYNRRKYQYGEDIDKILRYNLNLVKEMMKKRLFPFDDKKIYELYEEFKKRS
ncbi:MAG: DUF402 domain-containing protein [Bacilli bacterium]